MGFLQKVFLPDSGRIGFFNMYFCLIVVEWVFFINGGISLPDSGRMGFLH